MLLVAAQATIAQANIDVHGKPNVDAKTDAHQQPNDQAEPSAQEKQNDDDSLNQPFPWEMAEPFSLGGKEIIDAFNSHSASDDDIGFEVLFREIKLDFQEDGRVNRSDYMVYHYLNRESAQSARIDDSWSPWFEVKPNVRARVISRRGRAYELDQSTIVEAANDEISDRVLSDTKRIQAPLPLTNVGSVVEQLTEYKQHEPFFPHGTLKQVICGGYDGAVAWRLTVTAPKSVELNFVQQGIELPFEKTTDSGITTYKFVRRNVQRQKKFFRQLPSDVAHFGLITFATGQSWNKIAKAYSEIIDEKVNNANVRELAKSLNTAGMSRTEIIQEVLAMIQDRVRYTGLEFGISAIIPKLPDETWRQGFGDCKDKSTLLVALLKEFNIEAKVALLKVGSRLEVIPGLPSLSSFDHAIVYLPPNDPNADESEIWIDPTMEWLPLGMLPTTCQRRWALVADDETAELMKTSGSTSAESSRDTKWTYRLNEGRPVEVSMEVKSTGNVAASYRNYYSSSTKSKLKDGLFDSYKSYYGAKELTQFEFSDPFDISNPFMVELTFKNHTSTYVDEDLVEVSISPESIFSRVPTSLLSVPDEDDDEDAETKDGEPNPRTHDYWLTEVHQSNVKYEIIAPVGYKVTDLPEDKTVQVADVKLVASFEKLADDKVVASFSFDTGKGILTSDHLHQFREQIEKVIGSEDEQWYYDIRFTNQTMGLVNNGDYYAGIQFIQEQLKSRPNDAYLQMQLARAVLAMGLGKAARKFARKAVAAEPNSSYLHSQLGVILTHDLFGRHWSFGFDRGGAIEAFKKADELDPEEYRNKWNLALAYEHPPSAIRYGDPDGLDQAAEIYDELIEDNFSSELLINYLNILIRQNRFAEILKQTKDVELNADIASFVNTANIVERGLHEANSQLAQQGWDDDSRLQQMYACARNLNATREFELAVDVYEQLQPLVTTNLENLLAICQTFAESEFEAFEQDDPRWPVQQLLFWVLDNGNEIEPIKSLVTGVENEIDLQNYVDTELFRSFYELRDSSAGNSDDRLRDILSILIYEVKTLSEHSWITITAPEKGGLDSTIGKLRFVVKKEGNGQKVILPSKVEQDVGNRSVRLLASDNEQDIKLAKSLLRRLYQERRGRGLLSPVSDSPFLVVYQQARKRDLEQVRLAAAFASFAEAANEFINNASDGFNPLLELQKLRRDFSRAYARDELDKQVECSRRLLKKNSSGILFDLYMATLMRANKYQEVIDFLDERQETKLEGIGLKFFRAQANVGIGNLDSALEIFRELREEENPVYNNSFAWLGLFADELPDESLGVIEKVVTDSPNSFNYHTYASILATMNRLSAAKSALGYSMAYRANKNITDEDNYVLGLIAEKVGLPEIAADYFRETIGEQQRPFRPTSAANLAERKLAALAESSEQSTE